MKNKRIRIFFIFRWGSPCGVILRLRHLTTDVGTFCAQLLIQFYTDQFETLHDYLSWSVDMHVVLAFYRQFYFYHFFFYF